MDPLVDDLTNVLLASLRFAPVLAFAQPFTLLRVPAIVRVLLAFGIGLWIVGAVPESAGSIPRDGRLLSAGVTELFLGAMIAFGLQWAFAMVLMAGRVLDIQAGFGLALLADPTSRNQMPLVGTVFAYGTAAVFFLTGGGEELLGVVMESVRQVPIGSFAYSLNLQALMAFTSATFFLALALAGACLLTLFLIDMTVALMSRTLPQMNVLLIGFQVKTMALLVVLSLSIASSAGLFLKIVRLALGGSGALYVS